MARSPQVLDSRRPSQESLIESNGDIVASGKTTASLTNFDPTQLQIAIARYTSTGNLDPTFNTTGTAIISLAASSASPGLEQADLSLAPLDTSLLSEFLSFDQSLQGIVAIAQNGDLLDVGNNGVNTVEAEIVASGIDLAATVLSALPTSVVGGGKGNETLKVTESGTDVANGTISIEVFASPTLTLDPNAAPFRITNAKIDLKSNQSKTFKFDFFFPTTLAQGDYYLVSQVSSNGITDLNPNNNAAVSTTTVNITPAFVDLATSALNVTGALTVGKPVNFSFTITNDGNVTAKATTSIEYLASTDTTTADGSVISNPPLHLNLKAGAMMVVHARVVIPDTIPSLSDYFLAWVDPNNDLNDSNTENNVSTSALLTVKT